MSAKISAATRKALFRSQVKGKIGAANPFALFMTKNFQSVAKLPFEKRAPTIAEAYRNQSAEALASLQAEAKKNGALRAAARNKIKAKTSCVSPYTLFVTKNKALYGELGFTGATKAIANKYKALSAAEKAELAKKAAANNAAVKKAADRLKKA